MMKSKAFVITMATVLLFCVQDGLSAEHEIYIMRVASAISPGIADYIEQGIDTASDENAACLVIELDTPGGLAESMHQIVKAIYASKVPIVVYVSPSGARAASAGVMITMAADIAAMAPGTNIGAASPVNIGGQQPDETMSNKIMNDMVAKAKSIAEKQGRNIEWAEKAVRDAESVTETEALKEKIIDLVAKDIDDLIEQINGREIADKGILKLDGAEKKRLEETLRTKILKTIGDPNIAYILMMIGLAGLYFELSHPGAIFPGVVGAIAIILAFFSFQTLPVNYAGILLIILAVVFFVMEMKIASYGLLSVAGVVSLLLGSLMLYESYPGLRISPGVLITTLLIVSGFFVCVAYLAFRAQILQPMTGASGLIGETGVVTKALKPEGKVFVHGELWHAVSRDPVKKGTKVKVVAVDRMVLSVEETLT